MSTQHAAWSVNTRPGRRILVSVVPAPATVTRRVMAAGSEHPLTYRQGVAFRVLGRLVMVLWLDRCEQDAAA